MQSSTKSLNYSLRFKQELTKETQRHLALKSVIQLFSILQETFLYFQSHCVLMLQQDDDAQYLTSAEGEERIF